jgi:hypothetical protein
MLCSGHSIHDTELRIWVVFCPTLIAYISHGETTIFAAKLTLPGRLTASWPAEWANISDEAS